VFKQITTKLTVGDRLVMPLSKLKRAGFYEPKDLSDAGRGDYPRVEAGSLVELENSDTRGDAP